MILSCYEGLNMLIFFLRKSNGYGKNTVALSVPVS